MSLHDQIKEYYPQYSDIQHYPADKLIVQSVFFI